jgi:hypothetical protein
MSVTTTENPVTQTLGRLLTDYDLTHSEQAPELDASPNVRHSTQEQPSNPAWWPTHHNDIPVYRPIDRNLDTEQRPWGSSPAESVFVWTMLQGVGIVAVSIQTYSASNLCILIGLDSK